MLEALGIVVAGVRVGPSTRSADARRPRSRRRRRRPPRRSGRGEPVESHRSDAAPGELDAIAGWCSDRGTRLVADEIYHHITDGRVAPTAVGIPDAVVLQSFSKYFAMTGWRLGWLVLPPDVVEPLDRVAQNLYLSPPTLSQHAALVAFGATEELDRNVARYDVNRRSSSRCSIGSASPTSPRPRARSTCGPTCGGSEPVATCAGRGWPSSGSRQLPGGTSIPARAATSSGSPSPGSVAEVAEAARRLESWFTAAAPD